MKPVLPVVVVLITFSIGVSSVASVLVGGVVCVGVGVGDDLMMMMNADVCLVIDCISVVQGRKNQSTERYRAREQGFWPNKHKKNSRVAPPGFFLPEMPA